jgi:leucyl aminopeptidase
MLLAPLRTLGSVRARPTSPGRADADTVRRVMRSALALAATATVACSYSSEVDTTAEPRWISIDVDALGTLQLPAVEVNGRVAIVQLDGQDIADLSGLMHDRHHRCGGFVLHDTLDDALLALAAVDREPIAHVAVPYTIDNAAAVNRLLPALDDAKILATIQHLSQSFASRFYTSAGGLAAPTWVRDQWAALAVGRADVTVELFTHSGFEQRSVIATIEGTKYPTEVIVIGGHIDSVASGNSSAPGADDNASAIATITEVLRVLMAKRFRPERTVKLMAYAAEEVGLRGSKSIVADFVAKGINVVGVVNLDTRGRRPTST